MQTVFRKLVWIHKITVHLEEHAFPQIYQRRTSFMLFLCKKLKTVLVHIGNVKCGI